MVWLPKTSGKRTQPVGADADHCVSYLATSIARQSVTSKITKKLNAAPCPWAADAYHHKYYLVISFGQPCVTQKVTETFDAAPCTKILSPNPDFLMIRPDREARFSVDVRVLL